MTAGTYRYLYKDFTSTIQGLHRYLYDGSPYVLVDSFIAAFEKGVDDIINGTIWSGGQFWMA